jgi:FemAB-related protein (PEP-CTERM system-associated)
MRREELTLKGFDEGGSCWDRLLEGLEGSSFCHQYGWRAVMEDVLGHETMWWGAWDDEGTVRGVLPMVRVRSRLFGDYLVSMPFLSYGGPTGTPEARRALAVQAARYAQDAGVDLLELRVRKRLDDTGLHLNERKLTVVKPLTSSAEELWEKGIKAKVRSQIRRPMKEGMEVRFGSTEVAGFYEVFSRTMRDLGTPVLPRSFFEAIDREFQATSMFGVVVFQGQPVAAGCGFFWGGEFEITWAGSSREHAASAPNMLLYWGFMEECVNRGATAFNFGRCSPGSGTHRFKRQWGSDDEPLPWLQWSESGVPSTPSPDSPKFRAATGIWQRLPLGIANAIGPRVSRLIP